MEHSCTWSRFARVVHLEPVPAAGKECEEQYFGYSGRRYRKDDPAESAAWDSNQHACDQGRAMIAALHAWNREREKDGQPPLVLIYTAAGQPTVQCIAYSTDGRNFTKFSGNPVLKQITGGKKVPVVYDSVGRSTWEGKDPAEVRHRPYHRHRDRRGH